MAPKHHQLPNHVGRLYGSSAKKMLKPSKQLCAWSSEGMSDWPSALALRENVVDLRQSLIRISKDVMQRVLETKVDTGAYLLKLLYI